MPIEQLINVAIIPIVGLYAAGQHEPKPAFLRKAPPAAPLGGSTPDDGVHLAPVRYGSGLSGILARVFAPASAYFGSPAADYERPSIPVAFAVGYIQAFILLLFVAAILPGAVSAYLLSRGELRAGVGIGIPWLLCFAPCAIALHRRALIHIATSVGCAISLLAAAAFLV